MSTDWNWFFSSFCQSAAALIGIIAAFIVSRLLGLSEKINSTISQFDELVIEFDRLYASISKRKFYWYTEMLVRYDTDLKEAIHNGDYEKLSNEQILNKIYECDNRLYKLDDTVLKAYNELYKDNKPETIDARFGTLGTMVSKRPLSLDISPKNLWDNLNKEKDLINQLEINSHSLIAHFKKNLQDLSSFGDTVKPLKVIIIILMISFPLTVIFPLHFMPIAVNESPELTFNFIQILQYLFSLKFLLLFIFFASIEGIFYYFLILIDQLNTKLIDTILKNNGSLRSIKSYSKFFEEK